MTKLFDKFNDISIHVLNFLSSVATSLQNIWNFLLSPLLSYIMPVLPKTTWTLCTLFSFLQLGFWNRVMLTATRLKSSQQIFIVLIMSFWVIMVYMYQFAPWEQICLLCYSFPFLFHLPTWHCMSKLVCVSRKQRVLILPLHMVHAYSF